MMEMMAVLKNFEFEGNIPAHSTLAAPPRWVYGRPRAGSTARKYGICLPATAGVGAARCRNNCYCSIGPLIVQTTLHNILPCVEYCVCMGVRIEVVYLIKRQRYFCFEGSLPLGITLWLSDSAPSALRPYPVL